MSALRAVKGGWCVLVVAALVVRSAVGADALPAGAERKFVETHCTVCHGIERVLGAGGSVQGWHDRILRMVRWGAKVTPDHVDTLAQFLALALPPRPRPPAAPAFFANVTVGSVEMRSLQQVLRGAGVAESSDGPVRVRVEDCSDLPLRAGLRARVVPGASAGMGSAAIVESVRQQGRHCVLALRTGPRPAEASPVYRTEVQIDSGVHLSIPNSAILDEGAGARVFVQRPDGAFEIREVRLGLQDDHYTAVIAGLRAGEQVVSTGGFFVAADARLRGAFAP